MNIFQLAEPTVPNNVPYSNSSELTTHFVLVLEFSNTRDIHKHCHRIVRNCFKVLGIAVVANWMLYCKRHEIQRKLSVSTQIVMNRIGKDKVNGIKPYDDGKVIASRALLSEGKISAVSIIRLHVQIDSMLWMIVSSRDSPLQPLITPSLFTASPKTAILESSRPHRHAS